MIKRTELAFTTGRNGIKVPEVRIGDGREAAVQVGWFFGRLWKLNDIGEDDEYAREVNKPYLHELVVPPEADKPLVVVRGQYIPTTEHQRRNNVRNNALYNRYDNSGGFGTIDERVVTVGTEECKILIPPTDKTLDWDALLTYTYSYRGGSSLIESNQMSAPYISFPGMYELGQQARGLNRDKPNNPEIQRSIFNKGVAAVLEQFVELVSPQR